MQETELFDEIPRLDLKDYTEGNQEQKSQFIEGLGKAFNEIGFVAIKNHYLSERLEKELYSQVQAFFSLNDDVKSKYEFEELHGQRGYIGKGKEHSKDNPVGDLKEFYHVGQEVHVDGEEYPMNISVNELPDFLPICIEAYQALEKTGKEMLRAISCYLGLDEKYFDNKVTGGNSILRPIHYFPIENPESLPKDAVRAAQHGDINLITLLMGASADGLQILRKDGNWIPVTALPGYLVVNVGDMLERHTNNVLKSTIHRVVNPPVEQMKSSRFSIPFFMHPVSSMDLTCLPECIAPEKGKAYEDISAGEFLYQRLKEIGLVK